MREGVWLCRCLSPETHRCQTGNRISQSKLDEQALMQEQIKQSGDKMR